MHYVCVCTCTVYMYSVHVCTCMYMYMYIRCNVLKYILNKFDCEIIWFVFLILLYRNCVKKIYTYCRNKFKQNKSLTLPFLNISLFGPSRYRKHIFWGGGFIMCQPPFNPLFCPSFGLTLLNSLLIYMYRGGATLEMLVKLFLWINDRACKIFFF